MSVKEEYVKLAKKYKLPSFEELEKNFQISEIEDSKSRNLLISIRKKMCEKLNYFMEILKNIVQPDSDSVVLYEASAFSRDEKAQIFNLFKKFMLIKRESLGLDIESCDEEEAKFISKLYNEWNADKKFLLNVVKRMKEAWLKNGSSNEQLGYLG